MPREVNATFGKPVIEIPEYWVWRRMRRRCYEPGHKSYPDYGGRGIKVCPEWRHDFEEFYLYVGKMPTPEHSLDRIDNNGNYEPGNVRWATATEQRRNRRNANMVTFNGETKCMAAWAESLGVHRATLEGRLKRYPVNVAFDISKIRKRIA